MIYICEARLFSDLVGGIEDFNNDMNMNWVEGYEEPTNFIAEQLYCQMMGWA